jgi:hypothetical protein
MTACRCQLLSAAAAALFSKAVNFMPIIYLAMLRKFGLFFFLRHSK